MIFLLRTITHVLDPAIRKHCLQSNLNAFSLHSHPHVKQTTESLELLTVCEMN